MVAASAGSMTIGAVVVLVMMCLSSVVSMRPVFRAPRRGDIAREDGFAGSS
jgi:hypothetical protein